MSELVVHYSVVPGREKIAQKTIEAMHSVNLMDNAGVDVWGSRAPFVSTVPNDETFWEYDPSAVVVVPTGLKLALPPGLHIRIAGRSGIGLNFAHEPFGGVVDSSYRGEIFILFHHYGNTELPKFFYNLFPYFKRTEASPKEALNNFVEQKDLPELAGSPTDKAIAQFIFLNYGGYDLSKLKFVEAEELPGSSRGEKGFGSSDKK